MESILSNVAYTWLIAGVVLVAIEAFGIPGMGFLFAGLGALTVGIGLNAGWLVAESQLPQWITFCVATAVWAVVLWAPLQKVRSRGKAGYSNIVGDTAYVGSSGLKKGHVGEVTWSGTIMQAQLIPDSSAETLDAGAQVVIVQISGATLIVKPKN